MTGLIPILILGTLILVLGGRLLVQWTRRGHEPAATTEDYSQARAALDSVFVETMATKRIFAREDLEFISRAGSDDVRRFFLKERSALARQWLRVTRRQVARLMDLHLKLASYTREPSPRFELGLTVRYLAFVLCSNALLVLIWLRGPFEAVRIAGYTLDVAEHFCFAFNMRLQKIDSARLGPA